MHLYVRKLCLHMQLVQIGKNKFIHSNRLKIFLKFVYSPKTVLLAHRRFYLDCYVMMAMSVTFTQHNYRLLNEYSVLGPSSLVGI